jgi:hypothetical protein
MPTYQTGQLVALHNRQRGRITSAFEGNGIIGPHYLVQLHQGHQTVNVPEAAVKGFRRSHAFAALKTHAEKITSFNQQKHLRDSDEGELVKQWANHGVCAGLTALWLREKFSFWPAVMFGKKTSGKNVQTVDKAMELQFIYKKAKNEESLMLEHHGLLHCVSVGEIDPVDKELPEYARLWINRDLDYRDAGGAFVICNVGFALAPERNSRHALGFFHDKTHFYFFDANVGVYRMTAAQMMGFFDAFEAAYQSLGATLSNIKVLPMEKR